MTQSKTTSLLPGPHDDASKYIKAVAADPENDTYFKSPNVSGLYLRVTKSGRKAWQVRYSTKVGDDWRDRKTTIGNFQQRQGGGGFTVKQAERQAETIKINARSGGDPVGKRKEAAKQKAEAERQEQRDATKRTTLAELLNLWHETELRHSHKDEGAESARWVKSNLLPKYGDLEASEFSRADFFKVLNPMKRAGKNRAANAMLAVTKQMFTFAVAQGIVEANPVADITKRAAGGEDPERDRVLCSYEDPDTQKQVPDELTELFRKLPDSGLSETAQIAIHLTLATVCRIGELLKARWDDIDLGSGEWTIPEDNSKNGRAHLVNLSDYAMQYFERLHDITGGTDWCFPNASVTNHIDPKAITVQISDRQKGDGGTVYKGRTKQCDSLVLPRGKWTPHDLRRTGATLMADKGVMGSVIEHCLNHTQEDRMARIYNRHKPRREMIEAWDILGKELAKLAGK